MVRHFRLVLFSACYVALAASTVWAGEEFRWQEPAPPMRAGAINPCPPLEELGYRFKAIQDIQLDISRIDHMSELPPDCSIQLFNMESRRSPTREGWTDMAFSWAASELYHQPTYWENTQLERYGQPLCDRRILHPFLAGAHFFSTFAIIPYKMGVDPPFSRVYNLGYFRPGSPTPCIGRRAPFELDALTLESGVWLGLFLILP